MKKIALTTEHLSGYMVTDRLVVFNQRDSQLHALDEMGGWLLLSIDDGISQQEIVETLQEQGVPGSHIDESIATIQSLFFNPSEPSGNYHQEYSEILSRPVDSALLDQGVCIRVGKIHFQLISADQNIQTDLKKMFQGILSHQNAETHVQIVVIKDDDTIRVTCNGVACFSVTDYSQFMPLIIDRLQVMAYQAQPYLLSVHSAMLAKNGRGLILPGLSGSGKSTLCVSLLEQGYQFYSDEVTLLSQPGASLTPMVLPPAVKTGSWPVLEPTWPELEHATVWSRADGRRLKYLQLPQSAYPPENGAASVHAVVFPTYDKNCLHSELQVLDEVEALELLTAAGYQIQDNLTREKVEQLLTWLYDTPCYRARYASLPQAHALIDEAMH